MVVFRSAAALCDAVVVTAPRPMADRDHGAFAAEFFIQRRG